MILKAIGSVFAALLLLACSAPAEETPFETQERLALVEGATILAKCQETRCSELRLIGASIPDYTVLNDMPHVTRLFIQNQSFETLTDIAGMTQLTFLRVATPHLADLDDLPVFVNLTGLEAFGRFEDVSMPLSRMTNLRTLKLRYLRSGDIGFVADLPQLRSLHLEGIEILDLSPLARHPGIEALHVQSIGLPEDLSPLLDMPALRRLNLGAVFSDGPGAQRDENALWDELRARGVNVEIFPGFFSPEIIEPPMVDQP